MFSKFIAKVIGEKKQWRQYRARIRRLPANYRLAVEALERYRMYCGGGDGTGWDSMYEDLINLFEQSASNGTPIREIVGEDPVEFVEAFVRNYPEGQWRIRERDRLTSAVKRAAGEDTGKDEGTL